MALEQWEIDLRKQLEGTSPKKPAPAPQPEKNWEEKLRKEINDTPPKTSCKMKSDKNLIPFVLLICLLLGVFLFVLNWKTGFANNWFGKRDCPTCEEPPPVSTFPPPGHGDRELLAEVRQLRFDIDKMRAENKTKYDELQKKIKWNGDRITLLGMMHNENWLVIRNEGPNSTRYLYFNGDWTLSGMPQYLELTPEDRAFLERYQKKD